MTDLGNMLNTYNELEAKIHAYFGYEEDWVVIPMMDSREYYWRLTGEGPGGEVMFSEVREALTCEDDEYDDELFSDEIYCQRFLRKWVYRGENYTMVCADTNTDGNKFLRIFRNDKEVKLD